MSTVKKLKLNVSRKLLNIIWNIVAISSKPGTSPSIKTAEVKEKESTPVDSYWEEHTVNSKPFKSAWESKRHLQWRIKQYPLFRELMQLYGEHDNQVILDYGCGPGNDLLGFLLYTSAKKVIGIDVSIKALDLAAQRLALHNIDTERIELIQTIDSSTKISLDDNSLDYIFCEGVLHHTSHPEALLAEFYRVLKSGSQACIMVYNYNSLWLHLYTAYEKMIIQGAFPGLTISEAFSKNTDGEECPISRCYTPGAFSSICQQAGFETKYIGGYFAQRELKLLKQLGYEAMEDESLGDEHKDFLRNLTYDNEGYPMYQGKHAGVGGVYRLYKKA